MLLHIFKLIGTYRFRVILAQFNKRFYKTSATIVLEVVVIKRVHILLEMNELCYVRILSIMEDPNVTIVGL